MTLFAQAVLEDGDVSLAFASSQLRGDIIDVLNGDVDHLGLATLPAMAVPAIMFGMAATIWLGGAALVVLLRSWTWRRALCEWGSRGWKWWCLTGVWFLGWLAAVLVGSESFATVLLGTVELWWAVAMAGWLAVLVSLAAPATRVTSATRVPGWVVVLAASATYTAVFTWMNWQLYEGLLLPHGDSAMYEEHLWNIIHGKGFRSYLDQGLFLGEHIQVIHLALLPLYLIWPSQLLLELCESLALGMTALPLFWIARRHTGSERAAVWVAVAALLCFPLQYLDIAIDLKTFRPISFGVPLLLLAIDQLERRRWKTMTVLLIATLSAKEDYAIVIAPLGVWLCMSEWLQSRRAAGEEAPTANHTDSPRTAIMVGGLMAVLAAVYLLLAVKVVIPWFRGGETVHYARYFSRFGQTPTEIVSNMLTHPGLMLGAFLTTGTLLYAVRVLVPFGGLPLLSPSRLLVGMPLFLLLCLNELALETPAPVHHFHAPLLPVIFWAAAAGLANVPRVTTRMGRRVDGGRVGIDGVISAASGPDSHTSATHTPDHANVQTRLSVAARKQALNGEAILGLARFACLCAMMSGVVLSIHPLSRKFWDPGDAMYWRRLYVPGERAERFAEILPLIPPSARVASTDFVHPRFTHFERSYDYSDYLRKVSGYEHRVPDDTDYIVIDTRHPYSTMHTPEDVPEYHDADRWELLTTEPNPWFIVLKRRHNESN